MFEMESVMDLITMEDLLTIFWGCNLNILPISNKKYHKFNFVSHMTVYSYVGELNLIKH